MKPKKIRKISLILTYLGLLGFLLMFIFIYQLMSVSDVIMYIYLGTCVGSIVLGMLLSLIFWRCPYCVRMFKLRHSAMDKMKHCPYCGKEIDSTNHD